MKKIIKNNQKGFTLMELLIVVAIIAILVAIAIPVFSSNLGSSREAVCAANRRSMKSVLTAAYLSEGTESAVEKAYNDNIENYKCPLGGKITYTIADDAVNVTCTHLDNNSSLADKDELSKVFVSLTADKLQTKPVLYNPANTNAAQAEIIKNAFNKAGLDIDNLENWALRWRSNDEYSKIYWSDEDFSNYTGTKYALAFSIKGNYTVWTVNVENGVIINEIKQVTATNEPNQTYEKALKLYNSVINP